MSGLVQGVGFRAGMVREVSRLPHLRGFVRNLPDGRVEAVFAGDEAAVLAMVAWCRHGPARASVEKLEMREEDVDESLAPFKLEF